MKLRQGGCILIMPWVENWQPEDKDCYLFYVLSFYENWDFLSKDCFGALLRERLFFRFRLLHSLESKLHFPQLYILFLWDLMAHVFYFRLISPFSKPVLPTSLLLLREPNLSSPACPSKSPLCFENGIPRVFRWWFPFWIRNILESSPSQAWLLTVIFDLPTASFSTEAIFRGASFPMARRIASSVFTFAVPHRSCRFA